jgi:hypothetical protein
LTESVWITGAVAVVGFERGWLPLGAATPIPAVVGWGSTGAAPEEESGGVECAAVAPGAGSGLGLEEL